MRGLLRNEYYSMKRLMLLYAAVLAFYFILGFLIRGSSNRGVPLGLPLYADLFGVVGMVMGVPVFATLYGLAGEAVRWLLDRRGIDEDGVRIVRPESAAEAAVHIRGDEDAPAPDQPAGPVDRP